jgi:hypothetical protein
LERDTWRRSSARRHFGASGNRRIGVPEDKKLGTSQVAKTRRNRDRPSDRGRVATIDAIGKSPDNEAIHRRLVHRDIGNPVDVGFMHFGIAKRETPMSGGQLSAHQS